jgi:nanoRNase/pAp phosphatase (c-di-AMP/oligoRNAs hydrolase)
MHVFDPVKKEQERLLAEFEEKREAHDGVYFYELISKYHLSSPVSSILSKKVIQENEILVTYHNKGDGKTSASARRQDCKLHMGDLMRECTADFPNSNGGGHIPAAGAKFPTTHLEQFKKNVIAWVQAQQVN